MCIVLPKYCNNPLIIKLRFNFIQIILNVLINIKIINTLFEIFLNDYLLLVVVIK
jgi:hypothetical protein